jgi:hypothetical protein
MHHFRVLPTDERFRALSMEAKAVLFYTYLDTPTTEEEVRLLKEHYRKRDVPDADQNARELAEKLGVDLNEAIELIRKG